MALIALILFIVVPIAEIAVIIQVGSALGVWPTIFLLIAVSIAGAWLVKWQGLYTLASMQRELGQGRLPARQLVDGALILVAGALMLTPGFITDGVGLLLLMPPTRAMIRGFLFRRFKGRITEMTFDPGTGTGSGTDPFRDSGPDDIIDV